MGLFVGVKLFTWICRRYPVSYLNVPYQNQMKSLIILAVLRESARRVCGAHSAAPFRQPVKNVDAKKKIFFFM